MIPTVSFVIGGAQKCGTSALASYLAEVPGVCLPCEKEAHVFDAPEYDEAWSVEEINARYAPVFNSARCSGALHGDATPIYMLHERFVRRIARYNPQMRWIIAVRDPLERSYSHYRMERARGNEDAAYGIALLKEGYRLRGKRHDFSSCSPLRRHSYRLRGNYAAQLEVVLSYFPQQQIFLMRQADLDQWPVALMLEICEFLHVAPPTRAWVARKVFVGPALPGSRLRALESVVAFALHWQLRRAYRRHFVHVPGQLRLAYTGGGKRR